MIREELQLVTTGTGEVLSLAAALERAGRAQRALGARGGGQTGVAGIVSSRVDELNARGFVQYQLRQQGAIADLVGQRVRQEGNAARDAVDLKKKELELEKERVRAGSRREQIADRVAARAERAARARGGVRGSRARDVAATDAGLTLTDMKSALDLATQVASRVGDIAIRAGSAVIQAQAFREDVSRGLETTLRSRGEAQKALSTAAQAADFIGRGRAEVTGDFLDLLTKGFSTSKTDEIVKRLADLQTVDPRANQAGITRAIGQIAGKGRLQGDELLQLAEAGLETKSVYDALAKSLGKTVPEIQKLQSAGKITSDVAVEAILDAIKTQTGGKGAGAAANEKSMNDLSGLINRVKSIPENVLFDLDAGPGMERVKVTLREIVEYFDAGTKTGKEVRQVLGDTVNAIVEGLFGVDTSGGITATLQGIVDTLRASKDDIKAFASGVSTIAGAIAWIGSTAGSVSNLRTEFEKLSGVNIGGFFGIWKGLLIGIPSIIAQAISGAIESLTGFSLWDAGANLINSLGAGIKSGAQAVIDAVTSTVGGAISWAKKMLGIASPSRVFMGIGAYTSQGFVAGIASNDNAVAAAAGAMAQRAIGGAAGAAFPAAGGPGAGVMGAGATAGQSGAAGASAAPGVSIGQVVIQVQGARSDAEAASQGDAAGRAFLDRLRVWYPVYVREQAA